MNCPGLQEQQNDEVINLLDYLQVIAKRSKMIIGITTAAFIIAVVCSLMLPKIYSSTTLILPPQQDQGLSSLMTGQMGGMNTLASSLLGGSSSGDLYVGILKSDAVKDMIIDRFNLMDAYKQKYRLDMYEVLDSKVNISLGKKDGIISITVEDKDPNRAAKIANAYVEDLKRLTASMNITGAGLNRNYYENSLQKAKIELAKAEDSLKSFQLKNKVVDVPAQTQASIAGVANLKAQLAVQEVQLASLSRLFTDESQEVKSANASISSLKRQIAGLESNTSSTSSIPSMGAVPALGEQYLRLMREFKMQEAIVELLAKQYEIAKINEANDVSAIQVIQSARVPDKKNKPKRTMIVISATLISFCSAVLLAFIFESFERMSELDRLKFQAVCAYLPTMSYIKLRSKFIK